MDLAKRILVIDDEERIALSYATALEEAGFTVDVAQKGEEGIKKFKENKADLVFADLQMPGLADGVTVLEQIHDIDPKVPVYIVTGHAMEFLNALTGEIQKGLNVKVLNKPISLSELVSTAKTALGVSTA